MARCTPVPADAAVPCAIAGDAVAHAIAATDWLDVQAPQFTWCGPPVALPAPATSAATAPVGSCSGCSADATPDLGSVRHNDQRGRRRLSIPACSGAVNARGRRNGRKLRLASLAAHSVLSRARHLKQVYLLASAAGRATLQPLSSTLLTRRARPLGVKLAGLWLFIRAHGSVTEGFDNPSVPNQGRMNNLSERHT